MWTTRAPISSEATQLQNALGLWALHREDHNNDDDKGSIYITYVTYKRRLHTAPRGLKMSLPCWSRTSFETDPGSQPLFPHPQTSHLTERSLSVLSCLSSSVCRISCTIRRMPGSCTRDMRSKGSRKDDGKAFTISTVLYFVATFSNVFISIVCSNTSFEPLCGK